MSVLQSVLHEATSSVPIETRVARVFSLDTKFFTFLMQPGEKGNLSPSRGSGSGAEVDGMGAIELALGRTVPVVQGSSWTLLVLSGMTLKQSKFSLQEGAMFPLKGGSLTTASPHVWSMVVTPCTFGLKSSMRARLEHTTVIQVLRTIAALSTLIL